MKVTYLLTQSLESPSGLGRYWPMAYEMVRLGHEVEINALHPNIGSLQESNFIKDGVLVRYVAPMHVQKKDSEKNYYPAIHLLALSAKASWNLSRAGLQSRADIVHVGKPHPMNSLAGLMMRTYQRIPLILDCDDYEAESNRFSGRWQQWGVRFFENKVPHQANIITTNTFFTKERMVSLGIPKDNIIYLPNGVDRQRFQNPTTSQIESLRAELGLVDKKVIVFIGTLSIKSHPVDLLLGALPDILRAVPNSILLLVGGGEDLQSLKSQAINLGVANQVRFCGRILPEQVPAYYYLADVSVDPVLDNNVARARSPLKMFESWACGTPFVTGDVGDRRITAGDPPAALLTQAGNPHSLSDGIIKIITDCVLAKELSEQGFQKVENYYWDKLSIQLDRVYRRYSARGKVTSEQ
jgi:glycosyltransferase involved in cell wall biosynthesis